MICLIGALVTAADAQYAGAYGVKFDNAVTAQCDTALWSSMNSRLIYRMILKKHGFTDATLAPMSTQEMYNRIENSDWDVKEKAPEAALPQTPATRFQATGGRVFLPEFVKSLTQDAEQQKALGEVFENGFVEYEKVAKKHGFTNDLAGSMSFLIGCAYTVFRDGEEPSETGLVRLAQALQISLNTPEFRKIPDAEKQKFHELLVGLGVYLVAARQTAVDTRDEEMAKALKDGAEGALKGFLKLDPSKLKITDAGLEIK